MLKKIKVMGPGIMFAGMAAGMTHVVLMPAAGAYWGFSLIWVMILAYLFTYPYFEFGLRYVGATGKSIFTAWQGFSQVRPHRRWIMWMIMAGAVCLSPLSFSAWLSILSSVTASLFPNFPGHYSGAALFWSFLTVLLILIGRYKGLEVLSKVFGIILVSAFTAGFLLKPPEIAGVLQGTIPKILPLAALSFLVPMMALPGSPADVASMSSWIRVKQKLLSKAEFDQQIAGGKYLPEVLFDFRVGWAVLFLVGLFIYSLSASVLFPSEVPVGIETIITISLILTRSIGDWIFPFFICGVVIAIYSTSIFAVDGVSRLLGAGYNQMCGREEEVSHFHAVRLIGILWMVGLGLLIATVIQEPVVLVIIAYASFLIMFPLCYVMNIWAVDKLIKDKKCRPSNTMLLLAKIGVVWVTAGMILTVYIYVTGLQVY